MTKRLKLSAMTVFFAMLLGFAVMFIGTEQACAMGGDGSTENPYQISNYDDLKQFAAKVNDGETSACAILTEDIDCTGYADWVPIGDSGEAAYSGIFNGNGKFIRCLSNKEFEKTHVLEGLFGVIDSDGKVQKVGLEDIDIHGSGSVGGVAGANEGEISSCHISGALNGEGGVGGVAGANVGTITNCYNTGDVSGRGDHVGGVAGKNGISNNGNKGTIENCHNAGAIRGEAGYVGGVAGTNYNAKITNCYNNGDVSGIDNEVGGVTGCNYANGTIENCYNIGDVSGSNSHVGGVAGENGDGGRISNCYNAGDVIGSGIKVGGVAGFHESGLEGSDGWITNCYNIGEVEGGQFVGGVVGHIAYGEETVTYCYYDKKLCGCDKAIGLALHSASGESDTVKGLTTEQMTGEGALDNMLFADVDGEDIPWMVKANDATALYYPHLKGFNFYKEGGQMDAEDISTYDWPPRFDLVVATPVFNPGTGEFGPHQSVTISCATRKATIYYTTDGKKPTTSSNKYTEPIVIADTTTIKAIAVKDGAVDSEITSATYTHIHKYGAWAKLNAAQHQKVCQHDKSHVVKENHKWDAGKVTKKATEKQAGVRTYTCTVCKATRNETIPKLKPSAPKVSGTLLSKLTAKGKGSMVISWNKVKGAKGYDIYFDICNGKDGTKGMKKVKTVKAGKALKWTKTGLKKKTAYKAYVKAYTVKNGKKKYIKTSPLSHAYTSGASKKYSNAKALTVNKTKVTLKKGKTFKIKTEVTKVKEYKKLMPKTHVKTVRYMTSNKKVATVSAAGKITAKAKGKCFVYAYTHNCISKKIAVTVK